MTCIIPTFYNITGGVNNLTLDGLFLLDGSMYLGLNFSSMDIPDNFLCYG